MFNIEAKHSQKVHFSPLHLQNATIELEKWYMGLIRSIQIMNDNWFHSTYMHSLPILWGLISIYMLSYHITRIYSSEIEIRLTDQTISIGHISNYTCVSRILEIHCKLQTLVSINLQQIHDYKLITRRNYCALQ